MLCSECIKALYANLSPAAITILQTIAQYRDSQHDEAALNQGQIVKLIGLSISITRDALAELRGAMMVTTAVKGRGIYYALAEGVVEVMGGRRKKLQYTSDTPPGTDWAGGTANCSSGSAHGPGGTSPAGGSGSNGNGA